MYSSHCLQLDLWMLSSWMGGKFKALSSLYQVKIAHGESAYHSHKAPFEVTRVKKVLNSPQFCL